MRQALFAPFVAWGSRWRQKYRDDPFVRARVKLTLWYFVAGFVIFLVVGSLMDLLLRDALYELARESPADVPAAVAEVTRLLWYGRGVRLVLIVLAGYVLAGLTLAPIRRSNDFQKRFVANISHELRTPLAVIQSSADVTLRHAATIEKQEMLDVIASNREEAERMGKIMQFFLMFSRADSSKHVFAPQPVPIYMVAERVRSVFASFAHDAGVALRLEGQSSCRVLGDATALEEVVTNLVKNAITHTPRGGDVCIKVEVAKDGGVQLTVADTGSGIAKEDVPFIFDPFYRGKHSVAREYQDGSGLGLSIVKELVRLHDAIIEAQNRVPHGAVFIVRFPASVS